MKTFRIRIILSWFCYVMIYWTVPNNFSKPLLAVCIAASIIMRHTILPVFPKRNFSKIVGWGMFLTIAATLLYCSRLQFNDTCLRIFVFGLLAAFGIMLAFTAYHDIKLWKSEPASMALNELAGYMRKSPPFLISFCTIVLPIVWLSWFVTSRGYYEFHLVPFILFVYGVILGIIWVVYGFRRSWKLGLERIMVVFFVLLFVGLIFRPISWPYRCTPWDAHRARQNIGLIHPGMTAPQVWEALGLTSYKFPTRSSGSGPPNAWPINYYLWPGDHLFCRWNNTTNPPILVVVRMEN